MTRLTLHTPPRGSQVTPPLGRVAQPLERTTTLADRGRTEGAVVQRPRPSLRIPDTQSGTRAATGLRPRPPVLTALGLASPTLTLT